MRREADSVATLAAGGLTASDSGGQERAGRGRTLLRQTNLEVSAELRKDNLARRARQEARAQKAEVLEHCVKREEVSGAMPSRHRKLLTSPITFTQVHTGHPKRSPSCRSGFYFSQWDL